MSLAEFSLKRPFTVAAGILLVCLLSASAVSRMAMDIFPEINIPVIAVVWNYAGMSAPEMRDRIATLFQRQVAQEVDHVARIEAINYTGVSVVRVFLHDGASTALAATELASSALAVLKYMPRNITPPSILPYSATDVPIIQLSLSSDSLSDTALNDLAGNIIRPSLAVVRGASVTTPYGGKPRIIMADLDQEALQSRGLTPGDIAEALSRQNVIMPSGDVKIGSKDYNVALNNSPSIIEDINSSRSRRSTAGRYSCATWHTYTMATRCRPMR
jgi:multidrug efflux pump subunit AcrB